MSPAVTRSRSRKFEPALKQRAEVFIAQAVADTASAPKKDVDSRKRKRARDEADSNLIVTVGDEENSANANVPQKTPKARPSTSEQVGGSLQAPQGIVSTTDAEGEVFLPPMTDLRADTLPRAVANPDAKEPDEKRSKIFRKQAPQSFYQKLLRATSQRMIVVGRTRTDTGGYPQEDISIVGSTGNIYIVTIGLTPTCTCPDSLKGNECKHKIYALHTVLKAPERLQYQRGLLISELHEIFANAPSLPTDVESSGDTDGKRKAADGECPICYMDFDEEHNELVWCKAACGNNMHKECFEQWAKSQAGLNVKCVYCRALWQMDPTDLSGLMMVGKVGQDGYVNVANQMGMSGERDYSIYHQHWVNRQLGRRKRRH